MLRIRLLPYISQISHPQLVSSALELNAGAIDATRFMTSGQPIQPSEITKTTSPLHAPFPNGATHEVDSNGIRKRKNRRSCAHRSRVARRATRGATAAPNSHFRFASRRTSWDAECSQKPSSSLLFSLGHLIRRQSIVEVSPVAENAL